MSCGRLESCKCCVRDRSVASSSSLLLSSLELSDAHREDDGEDQHREERPPDVVQHVTASFWGKFQQFLENGWHMLPGKS